MKNVPIQHQTGLVSGNAPGCLAHAFEDQR